MGHFYMNILENNKTSCILETKPQIRKRIRSLRRSLSHQEQLAASHNLVKKLLGLPQYVQSKRIAFYYPNDGEIDPTLALLESLSRNKRCYYPVIYPSQKPKLFFAPVNTKTRFKEDKYGIPEPIVSKRTWVKPSEMDLVLLPLVAFDNLGNRIGMGGGFYDASFSFLKDRACWKKPYLIGIAHELQKVANVPGDPWDVPLNKIVSDQSIYQV